MEPASELLPLTERVLARLPGPRLPWILAWASLPLVVETVLPAAAGVQVSSVNLLHGAVVAYGSLIALWGVAKLRRDVAAIQPVLAHLTGGALTVGQLFRAMSSISMPNEDRSGDPRKRHHGKPHGKGDANRQRGGRADAPGQAHRARQNLP